MSLNETTRNEFSGLLAAQRDGQLDADGVARLEALVLENPEAREIYLSYIDLCASLHWAHAEQSDELSRMPSQSTISSDTRPSPRSKSILQWASRHPKGPAVAVAATVLIAALVVMGSIPAKQWIAERGKTGSEETESNGKPDFVARLSNWRNDKWLEGTRPPLDDPRLKIGRRLKIESGLIEVTYLTGARVVIEGPAEFEVKGEKQCRLEFGSLVAKAFEKRSKGFIVDTPTGLVEDVSTEFGVEVGRRGDLNVHVFDGEVTLKERMADGSLGPPLTITHGHFASASPETGFRTGKITGARTFVRRLKLPGEFGAVTYVDASPTNTTVNGATMVVQPAVGFNVGNGGARKYDNNLWDLRADFGSGNNMFAAYDNSKETVADVLATRVRDLPAGEYRVFAFAWDIPGAAWDLSASLNGGEFLDVANMESGTISASRLLFDVAPTRVTQGNRTLYAVDLGTFVGTSFTVNVREHSGGNRTWYDGVAYVRLGDAPASGSNQDVSTQ